MGKFQNSLGKGTGLFIGSGVSASKEYGELFEVIRGGIEAGIRSFDTAPSYHSEKMLGSILGKCMDIYQIEREELYIQTKIDAWQMQKSNGDVEEYILSSLRDMELSYLDAVLIHWPIPEYLDHTLKSLENAKAKGLIRHIGVCNVRKRHLSGIIQNGIYPEMIQIERNPLRVCKDEMKFCQDNNLVVQSYSPLCKMNPKLRDSQLLIELANKYSKSVGQIILRWHIDTGAIPIFTSTKPSRVREYANIFDFSLSEEDIEKISLLDENFKMYLESWLCPGF